MMEMEDIRYHMVTIQGKSLDRVKRRSAAAGTPEQMNVAPQSRPDSRLLFKGEDHIALCHRTRSPVHRQVRGVECNQVAAWMKKEKIYMIGIHHPEQT